LTAQRLAVLGVKLLFIGSWYLRQACTLLSVALATANITRSDVQQGTAASQHTLNRPLWCALPRVALPVLRCRAHCRQASFADFKVSGVQKVYQDALHSLQLELLAHRRRAAAALKQQQHKQPPQPPELTPQQLAQLTPMAAAAASSAPASSGLGLAVTLGEQALELQLVQLLLGLLYVELEAGYCEQALAKVQVGCTIGSLPR
jgi:hypothetical protein